MLERALSFPYGKDLSNMHNYTAVSSIAVKTRDINEALCHTQGRCGDSIQIFIPLNRSND